MADPRAEETAADHGIVASRSARHRARGPGFATGWGTAALWAVIAVAGSAAIVEALVFLASVAARGPTPRPALTARLGALLFLWLHHVSVVFESASTTSGATSGPAFRFTLALAILGGTVVGVVLLARGGRAMARRALDRGAPPGLFTGVHGAKVGLVYGVLCFAVSQVARFTVALPRNPLVSSVVTAKPSAASAFLWPLVLGVAAGFGGGLRASRGWEAGSGSWERRVWAALAGGWRMLILGLALSFAGLLILAAIHPGATRQYFDAVFGRGTLTGLTLIVANVLVAPNMAAWVLFPSMGSCLALGGRTSICFLSYSHFPMASGGHRLGRSLAGLLPGATGPAPTGYLLFLAVPAVAAVLGGVHAAGRAKPPSRIEAAAVGAGAGAVFGGLSALLVFLASAAGTVDVGLGSTVGSAFRLGPDPLPSILFALGWGVVGGALGGLARGPERTGSG
jgi:uncharacterized protein DUF6350